MIADDLFAGAGGWDLAAAKLGIHARGVENMKEARATRDAAGLTTIHDDVWTFQPDNKATGLIASPPCQTFSAAGKGSGRKALDDVLRGIRDDYVSDLDHLRFLGEEVGDNRTALVLTPLHFALTGGYEWLAWEQVPTVLPVWEACAERLRGKGWSVWTGLLQAEMFGVPQTRKRAFLLASRAAEVGPPSPTHSRYYSRTPGKLDLGVAKWVSMAEALGWHPSTRVVSNYGTGGNSSARGVRTADQPSATVTSKVDRNVVELCGSPSGITGPVHRSVMHPAATVTGAGNYITHMGDVYNSKGCIRPLDAPAPTVTDSMDNGNFRWHAEGDRGTRVTVAEAGTLQSFPPDYPWQGTQGKRYLQAGNAVPPGLALHALAMASGIKVEQVAA